MNFKSRKSKRQSNAFPNQVSQSKSEEQSARFQSNHPTLTIEDNRPELTAQLKLMEESLASEQKALGNSAGDLLQRKGAGSKITQKHPDDDDDSDDDSSRENNKKNSGQDGNRTFPPSAEFNIEDLESANERGRSGDGAAPAARSTADDDTDDPWSENYVHNRTSQNEGDAISPSETQAQEIARTVGGDRSLTRDELIQGASEDGSRRALAVRSAARTLMGLFPRVPENTVLGGRGFDPSHFPSAPMPAGNRSSGVGPAVSETAGAMRAESEHHRQSAASTAGIRGREAEANLESRAIGNSDPLIGNSSVLAGEHAIHSSRNGLAERQRPPGWQPPPPVRAEYEEARKNANSTAGDKNEKDKAP